MEIPNDAHVASVESSALNSDALIASFADDVELSSSLLSASVLIVPTDLGTQHTGPVFPETTKSIFEILKSGLAGKAHVEAAVREEEYTEFAYRSECIILPVLYFASHVIVPLAINLIASHIYDKFKNKSSSSSNNQVKSEIHFTTPKGAKVNFKYEGPTSSYEKVTTEHLRELGIWIEDTKLP